MSETKLVLELQRDALDSGGPISDLLRKALVASTKLGVAEFREWVSAELNGYQAGIDVREYRQVSGLRRQWHIRYGDLPVRCADGETERRLSTRTCRQSAPELEAMVARNSGDTVFQIPLPPEIAAKLVRSLGHGAGDVTLVVPGSVFAGILQSVRTVILNWTLKLEQEGILGEGLSFTPAEKDAAARVSQPVTNYFGPVGTVQVQHGHNQQQVAISSVDVRAIVELPARRADRVAVAVEPLGRSHDRVRGRARRRPGDGRSLAQHARLLTRRSAGRRPYAPATA
jgi:hypothetical protein